MSARVIATATDAHISGTPSTIAPRAAASSPRRARRSVAVSARVATAVVLAALGLALGACGYRDDNPRAAQLVAAAYLDAYAAHDAGEVCRLLIPEAAAAVGARAAGSCARAVRTTFVAGEPASRPGRAIMQEGMPLRARVPLAGDPARILGLLRYGSTWLVVADPRLG